MEKIKVKFVKPCFEVCGECKGLEKVRCHGPFSEMETEPVELTSEELVEAINNCEHIITYDR